MGAIWFPVLPTARFAFGVRPIEFGNASWHDESSLSVLWPQFEVQPDGSLGANPGGEEHSHRRTYPRAIRLRLLMFLIVSTVCITMSALVFFGAKPAVVTASSEC